MKTLFGILTAVGFIIFVGIVGGIDCGEPLSNAWWLIPVGIGTFGCAVLGGLIKVEIERIEDENAD